MSSVWNSYDLEYKNIKIEIKSSAYLQSWYQERESIIKFGIKQTKGWNADTGKFERDQKRQADIYIFCLLKHKEKSTLNPMDFNQWEFYIVPTSFLESNAQKNKSISLSFLQKKNIIPCTYPEISHCIEQIINNFV